VTALLIVRGTMILATVAWAAGEALARRPQGLDRVARFVWTVGISLALVHVILAFQWVYGWNHEAAVQATVNQAEDLFGIGWRGGIFLNYALLALWLGDVCWWWLAPESRSSRSPRLEVARFAFFVFMFLNGAVVFGSGAGRLIGAFAVALALFARQSPGRGVSFADVR